MGKLGLDEMRRNRVRRAALLAGVMGIAALPQMALAADPAVVRTLVGQARYWEGKGRHDLAVQAWKRALDLDPANAEAKRALTPGQPAPAAQAAPQQAAAPKVERFRVSRQAAQPAAEPQPRMESRAEARPEPRSDPKPARAAASDAAGKARMAGFTALQANDLEGAERQFQFALSRNRNDADAQGGMGLVALKKGDFAAARLALEAASRLGDATKWTEALGAARYFAGLETAQALVAKGQLDQARQAAEGLMRSGYKDTATAAELLADIYERQGRFADAADLYRQAGEGGSVNESRLQSRASRGRAMAAIERGDDIAAEQEFQQGLMLDQSDPWIRFEFARFMLRRGRLPETESLLASLSASADPDAIYAAAMLDSEMNRAQAAERLMARIPDSYRTAPMRNFAIGLKIDSAISRARTIAAGGQRGDAVATLKQLAATRGLAAGKLAAIADALYDMGDSVGAGALAMQALQGTITDMGSYEAIVRVAARTGRDDLARTAMQRATQLAGNSPDGQKALARMTAGTAVIQADRMRLAGQYASAFDVLQGAWGAAPDNTDVLGALARLYQSGRMWPRAAQTFQLILARDARNRDALSGLMEAAQAAGDKSLSQDAETRLLRTYPDNYESWLAAARTEQLRGNTGQATKYFKQARDMYTQAQSRPAPSGGGFGGNPFANQPMTASANPFRNVAPAAQAPAPAPVNPFALGSGTRLPTPAAVQPMSAPAGMGGAGFGDQGALPAALQPAAWQGDAASANAAYQPAVWQAPAVPAAGGYQTAAYQAPAAQAASGYQTAAYQPQAQQPAVAYQAAYQGQDGQQASAYPSGSYQTTPYQPGSYQNTPYQGGTYQGNAAPQMAAAFPPMSGSSDAGLPVATSSDPVLAGIERDIASMQQNNGPRGEVGTSYRQRAGETGLSAMGEMKASAQLSTGVGRGRIYAKAEMVTIDAGRPTGSSLARFGRNATAEAQAIVNQVASSLVNADTQRASGASVSGGYADKLVQVEGGTTPVGMGQTKATWRAAITPQLSEHSQARAWFERKPVTDSVISYAGTRDPVTGQRWGQVLKTDAGAGYSFNKDGSGFYVDATVSRYNGENVQSNRSIEVNLGGYLRVLRQRHSELTAGINVNYQSFANQQNYFTYGMGGYFSPQNFLAVAFPVHYSYEKDALQFKVGATPGFQTYSQAQANLYPTDAAGQAQLDALKALDYDVRNYYDSFSKTGFGISAEGSLYYKVSPATRVGGEVSYNSFGSYDEFRTSVGIRQTLGGTK